MLYFTQAQLSEIVTVHTGYRKPLFGRCYDYIEVEFKRNKVKRYKFPRMRSYEGTTSVFEQSDHYIEALDYINTIIR